MDFDTCRNFADLCTSNLRFLRGELTTTPYHLGPINSETYAILDDLIILNENGLMTTNSQPGIETVDYLGRDLRQNAYIIFICRTETAYQILAQTHYLGYTDRDAWTHYTLNNHGTTHTPHWDLPLPDLYQHKLWKDLTIDYTTVCLFDPTPVRNTLFTDLKNLVTTKDAFSE